MAITTTHGTALAKIGSSLTVGIQEHARQHPDEAEELVHSLLEFLRSWRPQSVTPLSTLAGPTEIARDPSETAP